ncbi:hypothetical protein [Lysobacter gummosus]
MVNRRRHSAQAIGSNGWIREAEVAHSSRSRFAARPYSFVSWQVTIRYAY